MSTWKKYHFLFYIGLLFPFLLFCFFVSLNYGILAVIIFVSGDCICIFFLMRIKCPRCDTRLQAGHSLFSKYYKGYTFFLPKNCPECGAYLD
jgi:hypothetical protein